MQNWAISAKLSLLFMNYGNLTTRIKIHLAQCMETRFARVYLKTHDVTGSEGFLR